MTEPAMAGAGLVGGFALAGGVLRLASAAVRWIVQRTGTKRDDRALAELERWLQRNPEAVELVEALVRRLRGG